MAARAGRGLGSPRPFLTAEWRALAVLNYQVDHGVLAERCPAGTELDPWRGAALVSLVGFRFVHTRVLGLPVPFHRNFDEINLRFYVRARGGGETRRGVSFVREIVPRRAVAGLARLLYNEPYVCLPMRSAVPAPAGDRPRTVSFGWRGPAGWNELSLAVPGGAPSAPEPGSDAQFVTERHWGYSRQRDGSTLEYHVEHPPWRVWPATDARFRGDARSLYGSAIAEVLTQPPRSAFLAEGSAVTVYAPSPLVADVTARRASPV